MTKLEFFNYYIAQWFFFRLARVMENGVQLKWGILFPVVPMTGWGSNYIPKKPKLWFKIKRRVD